jgi:hypothetical protein
MTGRRGKLVVDWYAENRQRHIVQIESREEGFKKLAEIEGSGRKAHQKDIP